VLGAQRVTAEANFRRRVGAERRAISACLAMSGVVEYNDGLDDETERSCSSTQRRIDDRATKVSRSNKHHLSSCIVSNSVWMNERTDGQRDMVPLTSSVC